jgi:ABC-type transporter Mla subunit MlaD
MADNSGGTGVLGVLVGALIVIVIVVAGGLLYATGMIGSNTKTTEVKVEMPKIDNPVKTK